MRLRTRGPLTVCLLGLLAASAQAQETTPPEVTAAETARAEAAQKTDDALKAFERYGRAEPVRIDAVWARRRALSRLQRGLEVKAPPTRPKVTDLPREYERLQGYRAAILERLRRLDPTKYPRPKPKPVVEPKLVLKIVDVQDLLYVPKDHLTPNVGLGAGLDASGAFDVAADVESSGGTGVDSDKLIELIEQQVGEDDDRGSVELSKGKLLIRKTPATVTRIVSFLEQLRATQNGLVELEIRVYRMEPELFAQLRASSSALDAAGEALLSKAVGAGTVKLLSRHRLIAHDGQRVHVRRGASRSLVGDLSVNATGVVPVVSPVVSVINEGLVVEARPVIDRVKGLAVIDVALSLGKLAQPIETRNLSGVEVDLPVMRVARTCSTAIVPLGRGALLGGVFKHNGANEPLTNVVYVRPRLVQRSKKKR